MGDVVAAALSPVTPFAPAPAPADGWSATTRAPDPAPTQPEPATHDHAPAPAPAPGSDAEGGDAPSGDAVWDRLAQCESGGNWSANTGNGYYGGLQFDESSWGWAGGTRHAPRADLATRAQQIDTARALLAIHPAGWAAWPACTRKLGIR